MLERRKEERWLTFKTGMIRCDDSAIEIECAVLDISEGGACLLIPVGARIPDDFQIFIDPNQTVHTCKVSWRMGNRIGVSFNAQVTAWAASRNTAG
jgi:hypothetical protein